MKSKAALLGILLTALLLPLGAASSGNFNAANSTLPHIHSQQEENGYTYGQCKAIAKSTGNRCKRGVSSPGDSYCWQHK